MADPLTELERRAASAQDPLSSMRSVPVSGDRLAELCAIARAAQRYVKANQAIRMRDHEGDDWGKRMDRADERDAAEEAIRAALAPLVREEPNE